VRPTPTSLALLVVILLAGLVPTEWISYDRAAVMGGEVWRLLSCHLAHGGTGHLILNVAALLALAVLFPRTAGHPAVLGASAAAVSLGIFLLRTDVTHYVGLSGVLHGILAAAALSNPYLLTALGAKLLYEQTAGALPLADGAVLVDAHLFGALGGLAAAAITRSIARTASTNSEPDPDPAQRAAAATPPQLP